MIRLAKSFATTHANQAGRMPSCLAGISSLIPHPPSFFDTHAHLDQEEFDADRGEVIAGCRRRGIEMVLCVGVSAASSRAACELADQFGLLAAVGIHPNSTAEACREDWNQIVALAGRTRVVALGETGLDRYRDFAPLALQQEYLDRHLRLSRRNGPAGGHPLPRRPGRVAADAPRRGGRGPLARRAARL